MILGVPRETFPGERRVALTPAVVPGLVKGGLEVRVETGAGEPAGFSDAAYRDKGATVCAGRDEVFAANVVVLVRASGANVQAGVADLERLRPGQIVVALMDPLGAPAAAAELAARGVVAFAMELVPRTTRAQAMDVLSSQATIAGYKAVVLAAQHLTKIFPKLTTAAGTLAPVRVFVVGVGVAGLQAIATARRLGAVVEAYDVRPAVREQVQSVGARFVELPLEAGAAEDAGGYATAQDESFYRRQREMMTRVVAGNDVVITTAQVPGRRAPVLVTRDMVAGMAPGSVVVDLAAEQGGNCELTRADEVVVEGGVTVLGPVNLAATVPNHASQMFARNVSAFLLHVLADGELRLDPEDPIARETLVTRDGRVVQPRVREALGLEPEQESAAPGSAAPGSPTPPSAAPVSSEAAR